MSSENKPVIIDTNILFSALLKDESPFTRLLLTSEIGFYLAEQAVVEIFKHKERLVRLSKLSEDDVVRLFHVLLRRVNLWKEDLISSKHIRTAVLLCQDIDETDATHVALTLELDGLLWTGDTNLKDGLRLKGFDRFFQPVR